MTLDLQRLAALLNRRHFAELEHEALEVLHRHPESGVVWQLLAASLTSQGKDTRHALSRAVQCMPEDGIAHNNLGNAFARGGQFPDAIDSYRRALALQPQFVEAHNNLAQALLSLGQFAEAAASCRQAIALQPTFASAHDNLGSALAAMGHVDEAVASFRRAVDIDRSSSKRIAIWAMLFWISAKPRMPWRAIAAPFKSTRNSPWLITTSAMRCESPVKLTRPLQATTELCKSCRLSPRRIATEPWRCDCWVARQRPARHVAARLKSARALHRSSSFWES